VSDDNDDVKQSWLKHSAYISALNYLVSIGNGSDGGSRDDGGTEFHILVVFVY